MAGSGPSSLKLFFGKRSNEDQAEAVEEEILSIVEEGHEQGAIMSDEAELISNVFEFGDKEARDVMTPRQKVIGIESTSDVAEALNIMLENNYSRYPIYEEDLDNIVGVLHIKEAVIAYLADSKQLVGTIGSTPFYIHPTQKISKLFNEMKDNKSHIAIVVDEYGQTEGIVAMEDMIEVIVGDILDEHDEEEIDIMKLAEGEVCAEICGEKPVFLFDDVFSELDSTRRAYLSGKMHDRQVIITTCEPSGIAGGKLFTVENGIYREV